MSEPLAVVTDLTVQFQRPKALFRPAAAPFVAVDRVDLTISSGETLGIVGESGSGKSTLGRAILGLVEPASGQITVGDWRPTDGGKIPSGYRRDVQVVWQDPYGSLNPTMTVRRILAEPLEIHLDLNKQEIEARCVELVETVGLSSHHLDRRARDFSGGQRQRIAIARAIALHPKLIILDEPVSALDVSTQSHIVRLLEDLQHRTGVAYLFIAHDPAVVRHISQRIMVMYRGAVVESGTADQICDNPQHPYTQALMAAIPTLDPQAQHQRREARRRKQTDASAASAASATGGGCNYLDRCDFATEKCRTTQPPMISVSHDHAASCYLLEYAGSERK